MSTIYERLLGYFETTPMEQIKKDWEATAQFDEVDSPSVEEFIENTYYCNINYNAEIPTAPPKSKLNLQTIVENPKFTSDFSF